MNRSRHTKMVSVSAGSESGRDKDESWDSFMSTEDDSSTSTLVQTSPTASHFSQDPPSAWSSHPKVSNFNNSFDPSSSSSRSKRNSASRLSAIFSGSAMERTFKHFTNKIHESRCTKDAEKPIGELPLWLFDSQTAEKRRVCEVLLRYAHSTVPSIQSLAFREIINRVVRLPSLRLAFDSHCRTQHKHFIKSISYTWRRPNVEYSVEWQHFYQLVTVCLDPSSVVMNAASRIALRYRNLDFGCFGRVLSSCRDRTDALLALEFLNLFWNGCGLETYLSKHTDVLPALNLAKAIRIRYELATHEDLPSLRVADHNFDWVVRCFLQNMWRFAIAVVSGSILPRSNKIKGDRRASVATTKSKSKDEHDRNEKEEERSQMAIWKEMYVIHCAVRSETGKHLTPSAFTSYPADWKMECTTVLGGDGKWLSDDDDKPNLRDKLMRLGETLQYMSVTSKFPPASVGAGGRRDSRRFY